MSWSFKPGDRVVCVDAEGAKNLTKGRVYTIASIGPVRKRIWRGNVLDFAGILLIEAEPNPGHVVFAPYRFRPVRTTSIESLRAHLVTKRDEVDA